MYQRAEENRQWEYDRRSTGRKAGRRRRSAGRRPAVPVLIAVLLVLVLFAGKGVRRLAGAASADAAADTLLPDTESLLPKKAAAVKDRQIVYLDAGHGGKDQGTNYQEVLEKDINLTVAKKVQKLLSDAGYQVEMTRTDDTKVGKYTRAEMANEAGADVFVSIHCNYLEKGEASGIEIYYDSNNTEGGVLAKKIQNWMVTMTGARDRGTRTEDFVVTRETKMPSVLVELGYLSDSAERAKLMTDSYQNLLAGGIARGVRQYLAENE